MPADSSLPGHVPAQEARWAAVGKRVMSAPISSTITSAVRRPTPGMVCSRRDWSANGGHHPVDLGVDTGHDRGQVVDVVEVRIAA